MWLSLQKQNISSFMCRCKLSDTLAVNGNRARSPLEDYNTAIFKREMIRRQSCESKWVNVAENGVFSSSQHCNITRLREWSVWLMSFYWTSLFYFGGQLENSSTAREIGLFLKKLLQILFCSCWYLQKIARSINSPHLFGRLYRVFSKAFCGSKIRLSLFVYCSIKR